VSLHGDVLPKKRDANYRAFSERKVGYMICTDMASRGLDFPHVTHVLHFDFPRSLSDYLHRAGRTGRAGRNGVSICLYRNKQFDMIKELQDSYESNKPLAIKEASSLL
jgi:superfamily II DNA/RNA helicase